MQENAKSRADHVVLTTESVVFPREGMKQERSEFMDAAYKIRADKKITLRAAIKEARARFPELHEKMLRRDS